MSVDIWAVGTIALTLLLGREVFPRQGDLSRYVNRQRPLDFSRQDCGELTEDCRDFITRMLASDPVVRPTAIVALAHPWLKQAATPPPEDTGMLDAPQTMAGDSSSAQDEPRVKQEPQLDDHTSVLYQQQHSQIEPATAPEIKQETKDDIKLRLYPKRDPAALQRIHKFLSLDSALLTPKLRGLLFDKVRSELATSLLAPANSHPLFASNRLGTSSSAPTTPPISRRAPPTACGLRASEPTRSSTRPTQRQAGRWSCSSPSSRGMLTDQTSPFRTPELPESTNRLSRPRTAASSAALPA
jgi:serine/threonine protein kinase